ncbi:NAD-dependent epimerase/dehydratase family protein [Nitrosomonas oligotropha]|uniref:Nucleoside-diphosphate-sugar epimerase n=1 Tax=Nitrosomonas oligotropha TaxID=42354 RepID=A0A1H8NZC0_9PROT|nr:NAD(P)-dependent oxidoreductase [Nitrosomonas oligotropha]SDW59904.1 Nucleoside-diphosphate-sugar epimerase [Nitrosomonas oligotropha]SEO34668.1 Nucleoside-diphosphate-sugar epimerase [Nitrosomonas oligotropha]
MNEQRVGLLGATSLAGECLIRKLIEYGWHVTAFSRHSITNKTLDAQITWQQFATMDSTKACNEGREIRAWLCVAPIWVLSEHFDLLSAYGARRIVVLSSTSRFTKNTSSDPNERKIAQQLIKSEELLQTWAAAHEVECVILRPTLIYGYGRDKNITEIAQFIRRFGFFPLFGSASGLRQPIHVEDVAAACYAALSRENLTNRTYNLSGEETLTYRAMVERVFTAMNRSPHMLTVPLWLFQIATWGLRWLPKYRNWTTAMAERMNQDLKFDWSEAKRDLDFSPRPFKLTAEDLPGQH